jgi:FixJ family two-component response regulator
MALRDGLGLVITKRLMTVVIEEAKPVNQVCVLVDYLLTAEGLEIFELLLTLDKYLGAVICTGLAHVNHAFDPR